MKKRILVITNFTDASRNALHYASQLLEGQNYEFLLAHIYTLPLTYTVEGMALASVSEALGEIEEQLRDEMDLARRESPQIDIRAQYILGGLVESSRELIAAFQPALLVFGTTGYYAELWHTDSELLLALRNLTIPVMIVPQHIAFRPVERIGFACDYRRIYPLQQLALLRRLVQLTGAELYVVHVVRADADKDLQQKNGGLLRESIEDMKPQYFSINHSEVFTAIDQFVLEHKLDLLTVIPRQQEFWYNLFHKSNIDQLAFLNRLPLLAIPDTRE